jgi:hypothetical protein
MVNKALSLRTYLSSLARRGRRDYTTGTAHPAGDFALKLPRLLPRLAAAMFRRPN